MPIETIRPFWQQPETATIKNLKWEKWEGIEEFETFWNTFQKGS